MSAAQTAGQVDADLDTELEARLLFAIATGLGAQVALYQGSVDHAVEVFRYCIRRIGLAP